MTVDRNNRSHKPKGTPDGGRYEPKNTDGGADDVAAPGMDAATRPTVPGFDETKRRMDEWYGRLSDLEKSGDARDARRIRDWSAAFDRWQKPHRDEAGAFAARRGDFISSDRETAAFMLARRDLQRERDPEFGELDRRVDREIRRLEREPKPSKEHVDAIDAFERHRRRHPDEIRAYEEKRGKEISSTREAAAYMLARAGLLNESVERGNMLALADEKEWDALGERITETDGVRRYSRALADRYGLDPERERILMEDTDAHLGEEDDPGQAAREMDRRYRLAARLLGDID